MNQTYKQPQARKQENVNEDEALAAKVSQAEQERRAQRDADLDELLADIDGLLEPNAQEFVQGYVQEGGQ